MMMMMLEEQEGEQWRNPEIPTQSARISSIPECKMANNFPRIGTAIFPRQILELRLLHGFRGKRGAHPITASPR